MSNDFSMGVNVERIGPELICSEHSDPDESTVFDRLYGSHSSYIYNVCLGILGNPDDARDAMQDTFVQLFRSLGRIRGDAAVRTWLYRVAVNKCIDVVRKQPKHEAVDSLDWMGVEGDSVRDHQREIEVRQAVLKLRPDHRAVVVLFYFEQLSYDEIAKALACSNSQVRMRLHRARNAFRAVYEGIADETSRTAGSGRCQSHRDEDENGKRRHFQGRR